MFENEERRRGWGESVSEWMKDKLWIWEVENVSEWVWVMKWKRFGDDDYVLIKIWNKLFDVNEMSNDKWEIEM